MCPTRLKTNSLYNVKFILCHCFSQNQNGPLYLLTILPQNIHAFAFEYLCCAHSSVNRSLLSSLNVTQEILCAPPFAQTSSETKTRLRLSLVQVRPFCATHACLTAGVTAWDDHEREKETIRIESIDLIASMVF